MQLGEHKLGWKSNTYRDQKHQNFAYIWSTRFGEEIYPKEEIIDVPR